MADAGVIGRVGRTRRRCDGRDGRSGRSWRRVIGSEAVVEDKLELRWSPTQISGWLVEEFPGDPEMRVSHETIYVSLFVQSRGALRKELTRYLRSGHSTRRPRGHTVMNGQGQLRGMLNIRERSAEADDRAVPGHWEGDLLVLVHAGRVERHCRPSAYRSAVTCAEPSSSSSVTARSVIAGDLTVPSKRVRLSPRER